MSASQVMPNVDYHGHEGSWMPFGSYNGSRKDITNHFNAYHVVSASSGRQSGHAAASEKGESEVPCRLSSRNRHQLAK